MLAAAFAVAVVLPVCTAGAGSLRLGVADDWPKYHPCGDVWWQSALDIGYSEVRMTIQWDETAPATIPFQADLAAAVDCALLSDVRPILAVYPLHPNGVGGHVLRQQQFAAFVALVGAAFPNVKDFVIGNEPNVNRFWQPQFRHGHDAAAADYEHTLAASYDALKAVRPDAIVWGPAISSRGNDNPNAVSNPGHSPVWFIKDLADAFHASQRTRPIFDVFDLHPYPPVQDTSPLLTPFRWPQADAANLDRIKQALWDGFHRTAQPIVTSTPGIYSLPIALDEVGQQTFVSGHPMTYVDPPENVHPATGPEQAASYVALAQFAACDPSVRDVLYFPLIDDASLAGGFQSGSLYADLTHKASYPAMKQEVADAKSAVCATSADVGGAAVWRHTTKVVGAAVSFGRLGSRPRAPGGLATAGIAPVRTLVTADEGAAYSATLRKVGGGPVGRPLKGVVRAGARTPVGFAGRLRPGRYYLRIVLSALANPGRRAAFVSPPFVVRTPGR
jgi:hypothetical protein